MKKDLYKKIFAPSDCLSKEVMIGYLNGKLNEQDTHAAEEHLIDCELCSEALDGLMLINNENVLAAITADVKKVAHEKENKKKVAPFGIWMAAAASVAIIIASIFGLKFITSADDNQLAMKTPYLADSLIRKNTASEERNKTEAPEKNKENNNDDVEQEISDLNKPPSPPRVESMHEVAEIYVQEELIEDNVNKDDSNIANLKNKSISNENNTADVAFNDEQSTRQSEIPAGGIKTQSQTLSKSNAPASANPVIAANQNLVTYIHDLKIINYSSEKVNNEIFLEPEIKHTEAQFASPEEKQRHASADKGIIIPYKDVISPSLKAYKEKNYTSAITMLAIILKENPVDHNALFYLGMSYFNIDNYAKAIEYLQQLTINENQTFYEEAKYYLAISHLKLNNTNKAVLLLKDVINMNGYYKERAKKQLEELD